MSIYVAFLRAINLGAKRKFPKGDIAAATEAAGFAEVATYINTGNVRLATSMRSRVRIEAALEASYLRQTGFEVPTICMSAGELNEIVRRADEIAHVGRHYVSLLKEEPAPDAVAALVQCVPPGESVIVEGRAAHLLLRDEYHAARTTNATVEKHLGVATNRNLTVIRAVTQRWC